MSARKRSICLILGPVIFALAALLLRDLFTTSGAQAIGISLWMIFWWITRPVDITITALIPAIANAFLNFHHRGFEAVFHTQHVGKQYFTNNENDALSLDAYCVTNLNLAYTFRTRSARSVRLGLLINNLFNAEYESNGYGYSYMDTWSGPAPVRIDEAYYFPQAPLNVLANVTVKF